MKTPRTGRDVVPERSDAHCADAPLDRGGAGGGSGLDEAAPGQEFGPIRVNAGLDPTLNCVIRARFWLEWLATKLHPCLGDRLSTLAMVAGAARCDQIQPRVLAAF